MAEINKKTGFYGYTEDVPSNSTDKRGKVNKIIFSIIYPYRNNDITFSISNGSNDWAAQMGDGDIIPLSNPEILFQNKDNSIVRFTMAKEYPSNAPAILVYRSDTASYSVSEITSSRPFTVNTVNGKFAFTVEGYGGTPNGNGYVNRLIATISFQNQQSKVKFDISNDASHWGARMGDGSIIDLRNPEVLTVNFDNAVVVFTMDTYYPSNSPCVLVRRNENAGYSVTPTTEPDAYKGVTDITNVPSTSIAGSPIDLSVAAIVPYNATNKYINWRLISGNATLNDSTLIPGGSGTIKVRATIRNGATESSDFTKDFTIIVSVNTITIVSQPHPLMKINAGTNNNTIFVAATSTSGNTNYQWYRNTSNSNSGGTLIPGATNSSYIIPTSLTNGIYYYYCEISSSGATSVKSTTCQVTCVNPITGIAINEKTLSITEGEEHTLTVSPVPSNGDLPDIVWKTSDSNILQVVNGKLTAIGNGSVIITVSTVDETYSDSVTFDIKEFISVTDITITTQEIEAEKEYRLTPIILPSNATNKDITWSISDAGNTGATIKNNNTLKAVTSGKVILTATINNGSGVSENFVRDFLINVTPAFIAVTNITLNNIPSDITTDDTVELNYTITPSNSTYTIVEFSVIDGGSGSGSINKNNILSFTKSGTIKVRATIRNGATESSDFTKDFTITVKEPIIPVNYVSCDISEWDPYVDGDSININFNVIPENATNKDLVVTLTDNTLLNVKYENGKLSCDINNMQSIENYENLICIFSVVIENGLGKDNFESEIQIVIKVGESPDIHISVKDLELNLPNPLRALCPILLDRTLVTPNNAEYNGFKFNKRDIGEMTNMSLIYNPKDTGFALPAYIVDQDSFDWFREENYLMSWCENDLEILATAINGALKDPNNIYCQEFVDFEKTFQLHFLPPWLPVLDILNIPSEIIVNKDYVFTPELDTKGGYGFYNVYWDEETPSNTKISYSIVDTSEYPNTANAEIIFDERDIIRVSEVGEFTLQISVENGRWEPLKWYDRDLEGEDFVKLFTINVVEDNFNKRHPFMSFDIIDDEGEVITYDVYDPHELYQLCSDDNFVTHDLNNISKDKIVSIEFYDKYQNEPETPHNNEILNELFIIDEEYKEINDIIKCSLVYSSESKSLNSKLINVSNDLDDNSNIVEFVYNKDKIDTNVDDEVKVHFSIRNDIYDLSYPIKIDGEIVNINFSRLKSLIEWKKVYIEIIGINSKKVYYRSNIFTKTTPVKTSDEYFSYEMDITFNMPDESLYYVIDANNFYINKDETLSDNMLNHLNIFNITSLKNFGKNLINLTRIAGNIPWTVNGDECMMGFLTGCTSFDSNITIPYGVTGKNCLKYFMKGCTSFNSNIEIPDTVTGEGCMHGFLTGCTSFDSNITIPYGVTGKNCLKRFLMDCESFNKPIDIPRNVEGNYCLNEFMKGCRSFNQNIRLPENLTSEFELISMFKDCTSMCSNVYVSENAGNNCAPVEKEGSYTIFHVNEQTFASTTDDCDSYKIGITITGPGAEKFKLQLINHDSNPYRNII